MKKYWPLNGSREIPKWVEDELLKQNPVLHLFKTDDGHYRGSIKINGTIYPLEDNHTICLDEDTGIITSNVNKI